MRLSDILKKNNQASGHVPKPEIREEAAKPIESKPIPEPATPKSASPMTDIKNSNMPAPSAPKQDNLSTISIAEEVYTKTITEVKNILSSDMKAYPGNIESVPLIIELIEARNDSLIILAGKSTPDIYLYGHSANLCILSSLIGNSLAMPSNVVRNLGYCALLFDFALTRKLKISMKNNRLTQSDINILHQHMPLNKEILNKIPLLLQEIKNTLHDMTSKRDVSSRYPLELLSDSSTINTVAQIIAISYIYEALTHPVNNSDRVIPHEAVKTIINSSNDVFDIQLVKLFVDRISIYPPGSYVKLNTNEIAKVTGINKGLPTRPKVYVMLDPLLKKLTRLSVIDLSVTPMLFIKEAIDETTLDLTDKKLALELKAMRWWVKGI
jgi:HD-GYP domain-containing protein (c-di-GMP phosphodiesterase class II)